MKNKISKKLGISICVLSMVLSSSVMAMENDKNINENYNYETLNGIPMPRASGTTSKLPKAGASASAYAPISGTLGSSNYNKDIEITVDNFSNGMDSVNMGLYVDGVFQGSEESITSGGSAAFTLPGSGKRYEIRMSTYSSSPGTCKYSSIIS